MILGIGCSERRCRSMLVSLDSMATGGEDDDGDDDDDDELEEWSRL